MRKKHFASKGVVANDDLSTVFQREIFFQVDPMQLDVLDGQDVQDMFPSQSGVSVDPEKYLKYLPELEQEIFYLAFMKQKNQKDIAKLLGLSQPTISYRYRRVLAKLHYIMTLVSVDARAMVDTWLFLKDQERAMFKDLLFYVHQEMVGKKYGLHQSSSKWVFVKARRALIKLEAQEPETWGNHLGLVLLLERNLNLRLMN